MEGYSGLINFVDIKGQSLTFFDTETTGLNTKTSDVVEIAWITVNPSSHENRVERFSTLINPQKPIPFGASNVHKIYDKDVISAPLIGEILPHLRLIFDEHIVSGYNSKSYDVKLICDIFGRHGMNQSKPRHQIDVMHVLRKIHNVKKGKLLEFADLYGCARLNAHEAMADVEMTKDLLEQIILRGHAVEVEICLDEDAKPSQLDCKEQSVEKQTSQNHIKTSNSHPEHASSTQSEKISSSVIKSMIIERIEGRGVFDVEASKNLAKDTGIDYEKVSFIVAQIINETEMDLSVFTDKEQMTLIEPHLSWAITATNGRKLKPLREAIMALNGADVDYNQIRIALIRLDAKALGDELNGARLNSTKIKNNNLTSMNKC